MCHDIEARCCGQGRGIAAGKAIAIVSTPEYTAKQAELDDKIQIMDPMYVDATHCEGQEQRLSPSAPPG
jgi:hypothetical protein